MLQKGDDTNAGSSPRSAWKSIDRINHTVFAPGDRILFASGQTFKGTLDFTKTDNGNAARPILVSSTGKARALIDAGAKDGCTLADCSHVVIKSLTFVGCGRKNGSDGAGMRLTRTRDVELTDRGARLPPGRHRDGGR